MSEKEDKKIGAVIGTMTLEIFSKDIIASCNSLKHMADIGLSSKPKFDYIRMIESVVACMAAIETNEAKKHFNSSKPDHKSKELRDAMNNSTISGVILMEQMEKLINESQFDKDLDITIEIANRERKQKTANQ